MEPTQTLIREYMRLKHVKRDLRDDLYQEAWVAYLEGRDIYEAMKEWLDKFSR